MKLLFVVCSELLKLNFLISLCGIGFFNIADSTPKCIPSIANFEIIWIRILYLQISSKCSFRAIRVSACFKLANFELAPFGAYISTMATNLLMRYPENDFWLFLH